MKIVPNGIFGALPLSTDLSPLAQMKIIVRKNAELWTPDAISRPRVGPVSASAKDALALVNTTARKRKPIAKARVA